MEQFATYIEELLKHHDFVTIPGFGGFVAEKSGSRESEGMLLPPCKTLLFNPALTHNDGLLAHQYVKRLGISFEKANLLIAEAVNELNRELIISSRTTFGSLGSFFIDNGRILFEMSGEGGFLPSSFGLGAVYFPETDRNKEISEPHTEKNNVIPFTQHADTDSKNTTSAENKTRNLNGTYSKTVAVAAAVLFIALMFPVRINEGKFSNYASIVPAITEPVRETVQVAPECTSYHAIIASFDTERRAERFMASLPASLKKQCKAIYSDNRFRIACKSFATETDCETFIEDFITEYPMYSDAWVLNYNP